MGKNERSRERGILSETLRFRIENGARFQRPVFHPVSVAAILRLQHAWQWFANDAFNANFNRRGS